jgi:predicted nuclease of predicted toxin-antitoxin system
MPDHEIIKLAVSDNRIIITMDKDFGELVYHLEKKHAGVVLLRLDDASGSEKARVVKYILENYSVDLPGSFCVYQNEKFRIRKIKA